MNPALFRQSVSQVVRSLACVSVVLGLWAAAAPHDRLDPLASAVAADGRQKLDPAAWGSDHVGKPPPDFVTGDECLFCHRNDIGPTWSENRHQATIRPAATQPSLLDIFRDHERLKPFAKQVQLLLGDELRVRYMRRAEAYGKLDLLSVECVPPTEHGTAALVNTGDPHWDSEAFGKSCAGCHTTGVNSKTHAFSLLSIDCYACHGDVDLDHTNDQSLILLSEERDDSARVVTSICGQCHIRGGTSQSTGLPYPNNFVPGDNLFRDFRADFSDGNLKKLNPSDRHVMENVRDVVLYGHDKITCLTCHEVHERSSKRHRFAGSRAICWNCHVEGRPKSVLREYEVHSPLCGY